MISQSEYDDLCKRVKEAWGDEITPEMESSLTGSYRLIDDMRSSILETLDPDVILGMLDNNQHVELRALVTKIKPRLALVDEIVAIMLDHAN